MGTKKPHRNDIADRSYPVRLTLLSQPETYQKTRRWLEQHIGHNGYAVTLAPMWSDKRAVHVHFADLNAALTFILANPHVRLHGEEYRGYER